MSQERFDEDEEIYNRRFSATRCYVASICEAGLIGHMTQNERELQEVA